MRISILSASFALFFGLAACGGGATPTNVPEGTAPSATPSAAPADSSAAPVASAAPAASSAAPAASAAPSAAPAEPPKFAAMTKEQKLDHMKTVVAPKMRGVFQEYDGKKYAKFGCATCHGGPKPGNPHDHLPKLTLSNGGFEKLQKAKPAVMKFMTEKVMPEMATAMNDKPMDPATHQGFGCGGCHTVN